MASIYKRGKTWAYKVYYYENGKLKAEVPYKNGKVDGTAKAYDENGKVIEQVTFKNGQQVK